jgi:N-acetylglutamate synthase-like GNAT family acetyltransferase
MIVTMRSFTERDRVAVESIFSQYWNDPVFLKELSDALTKDPSKFYVARSDNEIVGVVGHKDTPDYLRKFARTDNPVELYIIASKIKGCGIGKVLKSKIIDVARKERFSEMLLFSPGTHSDSWEFHDSFNFQRMGSVIPPDDDEGHVWSGIL